MIKPEIKLIKKVEWKHANWLMEQINEYKLCDVDIVPMVEILDPATKKTIRSSSNVYDLYEEFNDLWKIKLKY